MKMHMCALGDIALAVRSVGLAVVALWAVKASAQRAPDQYTWVGIDLNPTGIYRSAATTISQGVPFGSVEVQNRDRAVKWPTLQADSYIELTPNGYIGSRIIEADEDGNSQIGFLIGSVATPGIWHGSEDSFVDMTMPDTGSQLEDIKGNMIAGVAGINGHQHAAYWRNEDPNSMIDLHPPEALENGWSVAYATDGFWQGGVSTLPGPGLQKATLWKGLSIFYVNMQPDGAYYSYIYDMAVGTQVGYALFFGKNDHAVVWHDTQESWIDMHPSWIPQHKASYMFGTNGIYHVGRANAQAGIWYGDDPDSFYNLQQYVENSTGTSTAWAVEYYKGKIYVVGSPGVWPDDTAHAYLWIGTPIKTDDASAEPPPKSVSPVQP